MSRMPLLTSRPQSFRVWGLLFLGATLWAGLAILTFPEVVEGSIRGKYFQVEMLSPQYFRIKSGIKGQVSSHLIGGKGSRQLITHQENGRTVIYVRVPLGATLTVRVGEYSLRLWMKDEKSFEFKEECQPRAPREERKQV